MISTVSPICSLTATEGRIHMCLHILELSHTMYTMAARPMAIWLTHVHFKHNLGRFSDVENFAIGERARKVDPLPVVRPWEIASGVDAPRSRAQDTTNRAGDDKDPTVKQHGETHAGALGIIPWAGGSAVYSVPHTVHHDPA